MKKIISLILILSMCLAFSSCAVNPEKYSLALAAKAMEVKHSDAQQEGYEEFIDKLDAFAVKLTYEVYAESNKQSNICILPYLFIWHSLLQPSVRTAKQGMRY